MRININSYTSTLLSYFIIKELSLGKVVILIPKLFFLLTQSLTVLLIKSINSNPLPLVKSTLLILSSALQF